MVRLLGVALSVGVVVLAVVLAGGGLADSGSGGCGWAPSTAGRPSSAVSKPTYLVWHDRRGWHLRAAAPPRHRGARFSGRIATSQVIRRTRSTGRHAKESLSGSRRSIVFVVGVPAGEAAGLDFAVSCGWVHFDLRPASGPVRLGRDGRPPARRFTVTDSEASGVQGNVVVGPTCPVERPGENCAPRPIATTVDAYAFTGQGGDPSSRPPDKTVATDGAGHFTLDLVPGRYELVPRATDAAQSGKPEDVTVVAGILTDVTLTVDSGIRGLAGTTSAR